MLCAPLFRRNDISRIFLKTVELQQWPQSTWRFSQLSGSKRTGVPFHCQHLVYFSLCSIEQLDRSTGTKDISKHTFYMLLHLSYFPVWECVHGAGRTVPAWIVNCPALGRRKRGRSCCCYGDRLAGRETDKPRWTAFFSLEPVFGASYMWPNKSNCLQQELTCRNLSSLLGMLPRSILKRLSGESSSHVPS